MTEQEVLDKLRGLIGWDYKQGDMAKSAGVSAQYVNQVLNGHKAPSPKLLKLIGVEKKQEVSISRVVNAEYSEVTQDKLLTAEAVDRKIAEEKGKEYE